MRRLWGLGFRDTLGFGIVRRWELDGHGGVGHEALGHSHSCFGGSGAGWALISRCSISGMASFFTFLISAFASSTAGSGSAVGAGASVCSVCLRAFWRAASSLIAFS